MNQIIELNLEEYIEKNVRVIEPDFLKGLVSTHHLHQINDFFVIDGGFKI